MNRISYNYYLRFDEKINQYLVFLVHVQQSEKIPFKDKNKVFEFARKISGEISAETKKYFSNLTDYNNAEKNNELKNKFNDIQNEIDVEIKYYKVIIDDNRLFRLDNIIETLTLPDKDINLSLMDISNLFFYKEFDRNKKIDERAKRDYEELEKKWDLELETLKFKTFIELLNSTNTANINPELFYKINRKILNETTVGNIKYIEGSDDDDKLTYGVYFIKNQKEFVVVEKRDGAFIKYSINIIDRDREFILYVQGKIKIDEQEEVFKIHEQYLNSQFDTVLNGYRLKRLFEIYNSLFIEKYRIKTENEERRNKIDDYLSGKIIR